MDFSPDAYPYASARQVVYAGRGMVASSSPQASNAGIEIMKRGGNAIDAAVAAAACLTVCEPTSNGLGGDAFALVWANGKLHGLNASGPAPQRMTADAIRAHGHKEMPKYGWDSVTVPGIPAAWAALSGRFGRLPLRELLEPAAQYAEHGVPVAVTCARDWGECERLYRRALRDEVYGHWFRLFAPQGRAPRAGELFCSADMAATLRELGRTDGESFYRGALADELVKFSEATGGYLTRDDLAAYQPEWVRPLSVNYRGYDVCELPPNGHGLVVLLTLRLLAGFDMGDERERTLVYHRQIEAMKLAFADAQAYITDPKYMTVSPEKLLDEAYLAARRGLIGKTARVPSPGTPQSHGTVYLAAADNEGNMVSLIQSNYRKFGSGLVVPGTGIALHDRGNNFSLDENHVNCVAPGKRPYHTIIPGFLCKDGRPVGPFGVMGMFMQPQGHVQVVSNAVDFGMNPQSCLDAPRWQWVGGNRIELERAVPTQIVRALRARGHEICVVDDRRAMGRGQMIRLLDNGVLCGGTEPRTDGCIAVW